MSETYGISLVEQVLLKAEASRLNSDAANAIDIEFTDEDTGHTTVEVSCLYPTVEVLAPLVQRPRPWVRPRTTRLGRFLKKHWYVLDRDDRGTLVCAAVFMATLIALAVLS